MRILIVADNAVSRRMLEATLASWGHETQSATDGLDAWEALKAEAPPDVVILDWIMPGLDGLDVCRLAKDSSRGLAVYLIMLTSLGSRRHIEMAREAGVDDYLTKPLDPGELKMRLRSAERIVGLTTELRAARDELSLLRQQLQGPTEFVEDVQHAEPQVEPQARAV